jgi:hypothetical protein
MDFEVSGGEALRLDVESDAGWVEGAALPPPPIDHLTTLRV